MLQTKISTKNLELKKKAEKHRKITETLTTLYESKNNDYGDSVSDTYAKFGIDAYLVRMYDKLNRIYNLTRPTQETKVLNEKLTDTLLDLANYAILAIMELEEKESGKIQNLFEKATTITKEDIMINQETEGDWHGKHFKED